MNNLKNITMEAMENENLASTQQQVKQTQCHKLKHQPIQTHIDQVIITQAAVINNLQVVHNHLDQRYHKQLQQHHQQLHQ